MMLFSPPLNNSRQRNKQLNNSPASRTNKFALIKKNKKDSEEWELKHTKDVLLVF